MNMLRKYNKEEMKPCLMNKCIKNVGGVIDKIINKGTHLMYERYLKQKIPGNTIDFAYELAGLALE